MQKIGAINMKILIGILIIILILVAGLVTYLFVTNSYIVSENNNGSNTTPKKVLDTKNIDNNDKKDLDIVDPQIIVDKNPVLSSDQEKALIQLGIDPSTLPKEITPELLVCFNDAVGKDRVNDILINGDFPSIEEFNKIGLCL